MSLLKKRYRVYAWNYKDYDAELTNVVHTTRNLANAHAFVQQHREHYHNFSVIDTKGGFGTVFDDIPYPGYGGPPA